MALSTRLATSSNVRSGGPVLFRTLPSHGNDALLPLLPLSPSLCTLLIRLLLLHIDRSDLWITEIEVGESLFECASTVVEWDEYVRKIYLLSSIAGTFGAALKAQGFLLSRVLFPPYTYVRLAPSSKRWRNHQLAVFRSAFPAMTTVWMENFVTSSSTHMSAFQRTESRQL
jgi:hypothetical protein